MSEQFIDTTSDEFITAPKALRDAYDALKVRYTETAQQRDTFKSRATDTVLGDALKEFTNPTLVRKSLEADGIDALNTEAVNTWLAENGTGFARATGSTPAQSHANDPEIAAQQRIAGADLSTPADMSKLEAALLEVTPDMTPEQVIEVYRKRGI